LDLLSSREDAKILAGGHSLLPAMNLRLAQPALLVDIGRIGGLSYMRESGDQIGAGVTVRSRMNSGSSGLWAGRNPLVCQ
jgi:aerobic carbon-monoxide dehydrogenase medium subunit